MGVLLGLSTCGVSGRCVNQFTWNSQSAYTQHMDYKWVMHTSVFPCSKLRLCLHYLCFVVWILWLRLMALASFRDTVAVSQWAVIYWQHWRNSCECERPWPYIPTSLCWHAGVFRVLFTVVTHTHTWPVAHRSEFTYVCQRVNYFTDGTVTGVILLVHVFGSINSLYCFATVVTKT